MHNLWSFLL